MERLAAAGIGSSGDTMSVIRASPIEMPEEIKDSLKSLCMKKYAMN